MKKIMLFVFSTFLIAKSFAQRLEKIYRNSSDSTADRYIAVIPDNGAPTGLLVLLDGFGASPEGLLLETDLPRYAASKGLLTMIPVLKPGPLYFGADSASQISLKEQIEAVVKKYKLEGKKLFIGGLSIGGTCAVKYAELASQNNYPLKPSAVFGVDPPLDFERFYDGAKRVMRLSDPAKVIGEVPYMINRIEKEMGGTPQNAREQFYNISPYSYSDTAQRAVKTLLHTPLMLITEPDIQWWMQNRGYDYSYINAPDLASMINELQRLGNNNAVLITTENKGFRRGNVRHPHSWSIADNKAVIDWLEKVSN